MTYLHCAPAGVRARAHVHESQQAGRFLPGFASHNAEPPHPREGLISMPTPVRRDASPSPARPKPELSPTVKLSPVSPNAPRVPKDPLCVAGPEHRQAPPSPAPTNASSSSMYSDGSYWKRLVVCSAWLCDVSYTTSFGSSSLFYYLRYDPQG